MYTMITRRRMNPERRDETLERARSEFFPKLQSSPGFIGFYLVADQENGMNCAVIVWDSKEHADAFLPEGQAWQQKLDEMGHTLESQNRGETVVSLDASHQ